MRGHGIGNAVLQTGKQFVGIKGVQPSGNYAIKIIFDDGHDSGLYTWDYLRDLCQNHDQYWQTYLQKLQDAGESRNDGLDRPRLISDLTSVRDKPRRCRYNACNIIVKRSPES